MITVIIPTFNRAYFLGEAIQSVLDQDYFREKKHRDSFELLVIDDGSEDGTEELVAALKADVSYHYQDHKGVSAARNLGIRLARGEFIAFLDSDDLWKKEKLRTQMAFMHAFPWARVCCTEEIWIRRGKYHNPGKKHRKHSGWIFDKVLPLCLLSLSSSLFRKEIFDEIGVFDEDLPVCEDYDFSLRLAHKYPIYFLEKRLIVKRGGHPDQLSLKYWGMDRFRIKALERALSLDLTPEQEKRVRSEIVKKSRILANGFLKRRRKEEAERYFHLIEKYQ
ncbi:MAG: glycosyltransferase [Candidatus Aminicenantales bacterium]